jgi:hypothetical protein
VLRLRFVFTGSDLLYAPWCLQAADLIEEMLVKDDAPPPAEAATEVGQDDPDFYGRQFMLEELGSLLAWALGIFAVVVLLGFLVGRFV